MKNRSYLFTLFALAVGTFAIAQLVLFVANKAQQGVKVESIAIKPVESQISADGSIHSESEAVLHFQIGGKLIYLPFKKGDTVYQGQTIASLDSRAIQKNIQSAVDNYKNQQISYDKTYEKNGSRTLADTGLSVDARRELETAINTLDQTQLATEVQQLAQEQAVLSSPITGVITGEDVTLPNVNITPLTSFSVADPKALVFQAFVLPQDIDFVQVGSNAKISIDGWPGVTMNGSVERIYPQKTILPDGSQAYQVDITCPEFKNGTKLGQTGHVFIQSIGQAESMLVPVWAVVGHQYIWLLENNKPILHKVTVGSMHGDEIEISGLNSPDQKAILDPKSIALTKYKLL